MVGGYHIPRASDPDLPALEVLAAVLSAGESSRLPERLVRHDHLAIAAGGVTESLEDPGLFIVYAAHLPNKDGAQVQAALSEEIARVRDKPIEPAELDRAKNQLAASFVFGLETVDGVATRLGESQYVEGDWRRFIEGAKRYLVVTAADVQRVARKYLVDTNLTRVTLVPGGPPPRTGRAAAGTGRAAARSQEMTTRGRRASVALRRSVGRFSAAARARRPSRRPPQESVDVQYESVSRPATPAAASTFWTGRTDLIDPRRRPSRRRWRSPRSIASRCRTGCR